MLWKRFLSFSLLGLMLLVQAHAALPHQHIEAGGSCGAVCHEHAEGAGHTGWWESLLHGVHEVLHQHAASMDCEEDTDVLRPAVDEEALEFAPELWCVSVAVHAVERPIEKPRQLADGPLTPGHRRGSPHRGPPSRG